MRVRRERVDDADAGLGDHVRRVDDAERRLAAGDERQRGADVVRRRQVRRHAVPDAERRERGLAVAAGRHVHRIGDGQASAGAERGGEREARSDPQRRHAILRRDQHEPVADHVDARRRRDQPALGEVVHPLLVGGDEDVRRRALLDLLRQERRRRVGRLERDAGPLRDQRAHLVERALQADRREHEHAARLLRRRAREDHQNCNDDNAQCPHPAIVSGDSCDASRRVSRSVSRRVFRRRAGSARERAGRKFP